MWTRKPGSPTCSPASPSTRLTDSTNSCRGIGGLFSQASVRQPELAAISAVFTIGYVAKLLGEDEDWLHELSIDMFPEDGCLHVHGVGEDRVTAFTPYGIVMPQANPRRRKG